MQMFLRRNKSPQPTKTSSSSGSGGSQIGEKSIRDFLAHKTSVKKTAFCYIEIDRDWEDDVSELSMEEYSTCSLQYSIDEDHDLYFHGTRDENAFEHNIWMIQYLDDNVEPGKVPSFRLYRYGTSGFLTLKGTAAIAYFQSFLLDFKSNTVYLYSCRFDDTLMLEEDQFKGFLRYVTRTTENAARRHRSSPENCPPRHNGLFRRSSKKEVTTVAI